LRSNIKQQGLVKDNGRLGLAVVKPNKIFKNASIVHRISDVCCSNVY